MSDSPLIEARGIVRHFGIVQALRGANFSVRHGEIVALVGDNGAGKSTLVRILSGADRPNAGEIWINGQPVEFMGPQDARSSGVETVYQDLALAPDLDIAGNVFLGREIFRSGVLGRMGMLDKPEMVRRTDEALGRLNVTIPPCAQVLTLSGGQRQSVAVARAAMWATSVILMDEPTAALGAVQTEAVLDLIRRVRDAGKSVVIISHDLPRVLEIADRVAILRLGRTIGQVEASTLTVASLVSAMMSGSLHDG